MKKKIERETCPASFKGDRVRVLQEIKAHLESNPGMCVSPFLGYLIDLGWACYKANQSKSGR